MSSQSPESSNPSFSMSAYMNSYSDDEVASLPSESTTESDLETLSEYSSDAEEEWRESIQQLELLLSMVLVPFIGKLMGRRCAYWSWTRFMQWKYPVEVVIQNPGAFKAAGVVEAAATL
ncbi:hypothetical protein N7541_004729 [Penicillium brevicompactum]|uniref:Uncharacterized protein n=1 Tax=Penicillium brevicompactum TaxID=5074 RepID=A0A9W9RCF5_PENBR|nr:uncharacterized protein N7506_004578 [Penicillium brevicompactum]KAJ5336556.1 hypothetical protein N7506_004578 [Penicillium brevicompactum]KAJ5357571.1 hypothetical protein N7541_004729 [Penicillium brevicompactum]